MSQMSSINRQGLMVRIMGVMAAVLLIGTLDYSSGWELDLVPLYTLPLAYTVWHFGSRWGTLVAIISVFIWHLASVLDGHHYSSDWIAFENILVKCFWFSLVIIGMGFHKRMLAHAHEQLRQLQATIPVCSCCRRVGDADGNWFEIEDFLQEKTTGQANVKVCPRCSKEAFSKARFSTVDLGHEKKAYR